MIALPAVGLAAGALLSAAVAFMIVRALLGTPVPFVVLITTMFGAMLWLSAATVMRAARTGRHGTDYTLQELEARFSGAFLRVSRSELVSIRHVTSIASNGDGSATLTLTSGGCVHVTRRRAADVRTLLQR